LPEALALPILGELIPSGIDYGTALLVEFDPDSLWYETSLTIAAQALRVGAKTAYHTFLRPPSEIRQALTNLGLNVSVLESTGIFQIGDSYTPQTGLGSSETKAEWAESLKVSDWSISDAKLLKAQLTEADKRWLHLDDNTGVLLQYNSEKAIIDYWRTRKGTTKIAEEVSLHSFLKGVASNAFYNQIESLCDGIIDLKKEEKGSEIEHYLRLRILRGKRIDSRWHLLQLTDNGEVTTVD
jgi:KaiC/GvpD/RAD55 family RecA-like ATPase